MTHHIKIAPSLLSADFSKLGEEVRAIDAAGADWIHFDVMDGHFVPNITFGPQLIAALRTSSQKLFDVHLMISPTDAFIPLFAQAGADLLTIHLEAGPHLYRSIQLIRSLGKKVGVSLNPGTSALLLEPFLSEIDLVLVMSVNPGFGGQEFIPSQLDKIAQIKEMIVRSGRDILIEVDGGVNPHTAPQIIQAGADVLVVGHAIFSGDKTGSSYKLKIDSLRSSI